MSSQAFTKAIKDATLSIQMTSDGGRSIVRKPAMDREDFSSYNRNNSNNRGGGGRERGGRWQRGGGFRGRGRGGRGRDSYHPRPRIEEEDEGDLIMDNNDGHRRSRGRFNPYGGGGGNRGSKFRERSPERNGDSQWWKVVIPDGKKHSRDWLMKRLKDICTEPFTEVDYHTSRDNAAAFYVNEKSAADALESANNRITTKDGSKLYLTVRPSNPPRNVASSGNKSGNIYKTNDGEVETSSEKLQVIQTCLGDRFNGTLIKLDLSNLYADKTLRAGGVEGKIWQKKLMNTILKLVNNICPQLKILDLSDNRLQRLDILSSLIEMCPELEELNLSNNSVRFSGELEKLKSHKKLSKLYLKGNPLYDQFKNDNSAYIADIRSRLAGIKELDGMALPPTITFDLEATSVIPSTKGSYTPNKEAGSLIASFLKNYMQVYDSADVNERQQLLGAYHNDAVFSMCCNTSIFSNEKISLNSYLNHSRNLKRLKSRNTKSQLIKNKKLSVVAFLTELPQTKHQLDSFVLDVPLISSTCLCFNVQGIFYEGSDQILRSFSRSFTAVPESASRFLIINDQLHVRNATEKQIKKLDKVDGNSAPAQTDVSYTTEQQELVKRFSTESNMNLKWSLDALVQNSWNYDRAALKFSELKQSGQIPIEAFQL